MPTDRKEYFKAYAKEWYSKNKKQRKLYQQTYRAKNKNLLRIKEHNNNLARKIKVLTYYAKGIPKCACCGEKHIEFLSIDHINGNGKEHRRQIKQNIWKWLIKNKFPKGFRVLCFNCNCSMGFHGYCPHKTTKKRATP